MKKFYAIFFLIAPLQCAFSQYVFYKWFEKESLLSTVLLEKKIENHFVPHGTGVLMYSYKAKEIIVITCEHVLRNSEIFAVLPFSDSLLFKLDSMDVDDKINLKNVFLTKDLIWNIEDQFVRVKVNLIEGINFFKHPEGLDLAGFKKEIISQILINEKWYKLFNIQLISRQWIQTRDKVELGDDCYFVGFPYSIGTTLGFSGKFSSKKPTHLLRKTSISWISDSELEFLLDSFSFPGNSGGPVFKVGYEPKKPAFYLIGIVIGHLSDRDGSIGLARCLFSNDILKVMSLIDK